MSAPTPDFTTAAAEETLQKVAAALTANNIEAIVVDDGEEARDRILAMVPAGSEVHAGKSKTLQDIGVWDVLAGGGYRWLRDQYLKMDRKTQWPEIRRLVAAPDYMLGSVQALTEDGVLVIASYSGSQVGPIAAGAGRVILAVGSQKIVPDLATAERRIREHVVPYEDALLMEQMGVPTRVAKVLHFHLEPQPGRTTVVLIRRPVGV